MSGSGRLKEKVNKLEHKLNLLNIECETYKTLYRAKHDDIKNLLPTAMFNIRTLWATLKKISDLAIKNCTGDCKGYCGECDYLELQKIVLSCLKNMKEIENVDEP